MSADAGTANVIKEQLIKLVRTVVLLLLAFSCFIAGLSVAARLQVWETAAVVAKSKGAKSVIYEGRVKRELLSGDYLIEQKDAKTQRVTSDQVLAMASASDSPGVPSMLAAGIGLLACFAILFGGYLIDLIRRKD